MTYKEENVFVSMYWSKTGALHVDTLIRCPLQSFIPKKIINKKIVPFYHKFSNIKKGKPR